MFKFNSENTGNGVFQKKIDYCDHIDKPRKGFMDLNADKVIESGVT